MDIKFSNGVQQDAEQWALDTLRDMGAHKQNILLSQARIFTILAKKGLISAKEFYEAVSGYPIHKDQVQFK